MSGFPWGAFGTNTAVTAAVALAVLLVTFGIGVAKGAHRVVDIAWGTAFAAVAVATYTLSADEGGAGQRLLLTVLTAVWGLRLSLHIAWRSRGKGEDPRYARMLGRSGIRHPALRALLLVYLPQAALVWLISLPVQAGQYAGTPSGAALAVAVAGAAVWCVGLFFEGVGDFQLARFTADPAHRGQVMDRGLWRLTRHPNYFGDFCVWWGLYLVAAAGLVDAGHPGVAALGLPAPALMSYLLIAGSGKRLLERHMADRSGFAAYAARTSGFFPLPPREDADPAAGPRP
ncbi:DUF1295 domain-containing protein [Streptomyces sp. NPDC054784]